MDPISPDVYVPPAATQEELYEFLKDAIEPFLEEQRQAQKPIDEKYELIFAPAKEIYNEQVKSFEDAAKAALLPHHKKLEEEIWKLREVYNKAVDRLTQRYSIKQNRAQVKFDLSTAEYKKQYDAAIAADMELYRAELQVTVDACEAKIEPLRKEYEKQAAELEASTAVKH